MSLETSIEQLAAAITLLASKIGTAPAQTPATTITATGMAPSAADLAEVAKAVKAAQDAQAKADKAAAAAKAKADQAEIDKAAASKAALEKATADAVAAASAKVEDPKPEVSIEQVRAVATELIMKDQTVPGTRDKVVAIWTKYGVTKIKDLKPKDYTNVLADLKALNA